jgi:heat shock protein HslJ
MRKMLLNLGLMLSLMGCVATSAPSIKGKEFSLNDANITLAFDKNENKFYGKAVNNYFGVYSLNGENIKLELQGSTMMMGAPEEMDEEVKYFNTLNKVTAYTLTDKVLTLKGDKTELNFKENK